MGKATSSMITVVPMRRAAPTAGKRPRRTSQSRSAAARSAVKVTGPSVGIPARRFTAASMASGSAPADEARTSTSRAQASGPRPDRPAGIPGRPSTLRSEARSMISAAATTCRSSRCTARAPCSMSG